MRIVLRVEKLVQMTGDSRIGRTLRGRTIEMKGDVACGLYRARGDEEHEFLG
jgi:hypothetical protein